MAAKVGSWADVMESSTGSLLGRLQHRDSPVQTLREESNAADTFLPLSNLGDSNSASSNHSVSLDPWLDESSRQGLNLAFTSQLGIAGSANSTSLFRAVVSRQEAMASGTLAPATGPVVAPAPAPAAAPVPVSAPTPEPAPVAEPATTASAVSMDVDGQSDAGFSIVSKKRAGGPGAPRVEQSAPKNRKVGAQRKAEPPTSPVAPAAPAPAETAASPASASLAAQQRVLRSASKPASAAPVKQAGSTPAPWANLTAAAAPAQSPAPAAAPLAPAAPQSATAASSRPVIVSSLVSSARGGMPFDSPSSPVGAVAGTPPTRSSSARWGAVVKSPSVDAGVSPIAFFPPLSKSPQVSATPEFLAEPPAPQPEPRQARPQRQAALKAGAAPRQANQYIRRAAAKELPRETNEQRLAQREKQLSYGKLTVGYQRYVEMVPPTKRRRGDPMTPDKYQVCSKRSWDGQLCKWRRQLHSYDPRELQASASDQLSEPDLTSSIDDDNGSTTSDAYRSPPHSPGRTERLQSVSSEDAPNVTDGLLAI